MEKNYKQKSISKKEMEEKEKALSACKALLKTANPASRSKYLPQESESWVEYIWIVCKGTHWLQSSPCLQQL